MREVFEVLDVAREGGVFWEGEDEVFDGGGGGEKEEDREVLGGDDDGDGDGEAAIGEEMSEVEERERVALGWIWN